MARKLDGRFIKVDDVTVKVNGSQQLYAVSSGGAASIEYSWASDSQPFLKNSNSTYEVQAYGRFPGSTATGTPTSIKIGVWNSDSAGRISVKIYDRTNGNTIAEKTNIAGTSPQMIDMGTLSNVPTGAALFEVQTKQTVTGEAQLATMSIDF
jgi:hypothetical protein